MANLRCLLVLCSILYVSTNSEDFGNGEMDDCCSKCDCINHSYHTENIYEIDCSNRNLNEVPNCPWENTTEVNLRENKIQKISKETFRRFKNIQELDLGKNNLSSLPNLNIRRFKLEGLNLDENNFTVVPTTVLSKMKNLRILYMMDNNIQEINESWIHENLRTLELDRNEIKKFPRLMMPRLNKLSLRDNKIEEIPENALKNTKMLEMLSLKENKIKFVHPRFLGNNTDSLRFFDLSMNRQLTTIPFGGIRTLARLKQLRISGTSITVIPDLAFKDLNNLEEIVLLEPQSHVEYHIGNRSFAYLPSLTKLTLNNFKLAHFPNLTGNFKLEDLYLDHNEIKVLPTNLCDILPNLFELRVSGNNLEALPKLSGCKKLAILVVDSNRIQSFGDSLNGLSSIVDISAKYNRIKSIEENDFKGLTQLDKLLLEENKISNIHKNAFSDLTNLKDLILTDNNFPELPTLGLVAVETLSIKGNSKLKKFPSPRHLPNIKILHLYYPYHCCAFLNARKGIYNNNNTTLNITLSNGDQVFSKWIWLADDLENMTSFDPEDIDSSTYEDTSQPKTSPHDEDILNKKIKCTPEPDPFFPCEDLMGDWVLRCGVWIVFVLALCGNATVIIVILASHTKMDVSRFLISNLAFADLFMGIYLGFLAVVDVSTLGNFKSYGVEWQLGPGCRTAGFLATLSSELSVFTLTVITVERYIAIKNAIRVNRKLQLKTAVIVMIFGWVFALVTATLPLLEVNTYGKFSVCLPFETDDKKSIVFLVFLLCLNAAAFIVILFCYILMYCSIRGSNAWNASDFRVAKRMALLVFTDFACWAPIVFFSLTATFGSSIINLSQAKIFTVFVFPLNSCCNPFLYAIFTSHFKKDLLAICRRVEDKYPFLKITKQRMSFSRRSSYSGAVSENPNIYLRVRRFSLPVFARGFNNSITTNGRGSDSSNSNKISLDTNPIGHDGNDHLLTERVTSV